MIQELLKIAVRAALEASMEILEIYNLDNFEVQLKSYDSPLTKSDLVSNHVINSHLKKNNIPILSEEGKDNSYDKRKDWSQLLIVDPIDDTKEFIKRNGEFTVNIAQIENQTSIIVVVYAPTMQWDTAAGQATCEHAGFKAADCITKKDLLYNRSKLLYNWFVVN
tara:strand:+ start:101 stop:595 length:495 start_codon:yes stop_codon:yes gene_type:complete